MSEKRYLALSNSNEPIRNPKGSVKKCTLTQWKRFISKNMMSESAKKCGFVPVVSIIPTWISRRNFEYVRLHVAK